MIYCISVINDNELDLKASYDADSGIVTINQFGLGSDPDFYAVVEMSYADFAFFISTVNSIWPAEDSELNVWHYYENSKFVYYFEDNYDIRCSVAMYGLFFIFKREHIDELSRFLTTDGRVAGCW